MSAHSVKKDSILEMKVGSIAGYLETLWNKAKWFSTSTPTNAMTRPIAAGKVAVEMNADPRDSKPLSCVIDWSVKEADGTVRHLSRFTFDDQKRGATLHLDVLP